MIYREHLTAELEGGFVVFLIGMRVNKLWKVRRQRASDHVGRAAQGGTMDKDTDKDTDDTAI